MNKFIARADRLSGPALAILGAINALFAISFLAVLMIAMQAAPAWSQECGGENILDDLKADAPARYEAILAEAKEMPNGDTLLFRIEKDGVEPSWLFGTMHLTDKRVLNVPAPAQDAFDTADTVAIESTEIMDPAKAQLALFSKPELTMFTDGTSLSDYLSDEQREILRDGLAARGLQLALVERMKPWLLSGMVALPPCEFDRKKEGEVFLDMKLARDAEATGKELVGLETIVEQFEAMASIPMQFHVDGLVQTVELNDRIDDVMETMVDLYLQGKPGMIWPMLEDISEEIDPGSSDDEGYAAFEEAMVHARNETMLERSRELVDNGGAFIAVGAMHLPGEKGLASLFQHAGYTVTPVALH